MLIIHYDLDMTFMNPWVTVMRLYRILLLLQSAMYSVPSAANASCSGLFRRPLVATTLSVDPAEFAIPATAVITPLPSIFNTTCVSTAET